MKKMAMVLVVFMGTWSLSSCAAIFHGTTETIYVRSEEPDTKFYLGGRELGKGTSAVATVSKKEMSRALLRASKNGCNERSSPILTSFDAVTLLGVFWDFGIFSILVVDWGITGAVNRAAQTEYVLTPECSAFPPMSLKDYLGAYNVIPEVGR